MAINDKTCAERNNCDNCPFKTNKAFCDLAFNSNKSINEILEEMFKLVLETIFKQEKPENMDFDDRDAKAALFNLHCLSLKELDKPQELYNLIKEKRDNAQKDVEIEENLIAYNKLRGQVSAYNDVLSLIESMFKVKGV